MTPPAAAAGTLPRAWLWTIGVALLALLVWWPLDPYWQSDDFLAVTYAHDPRRACADFLGPQYSASALVAFYRPLITLSFAFDVWIAGAAPFVSHLSNTLAHATSTLLLTLLARRVLGDRQGLCLGLLWGLWPTHAGSILWAVGRVDSHTTVWISLAAVAIVRWLDGRGGRLLALGAFVLALLSKELAFVVPGLVAVLGFGLASPGQRMQTAWRATWPFLVVFCLYMAWRYVTLGQAVGGYQDARFQLGAALHGLGTWCARLANPLHATDATFGVYGFLWWPLAVTLAVRRRGLAAVALCSLWFLLCAVPTAPLWGETDEIKSVRYFYLPATGLLAIVAMGGRWPTLLALLIAVWPLWQVRQRYLEAHRDAARLHAEVLAADASAPPGRLLVHGLPRDDHTRDVLMFHLFVDRLLLPPFASGRSVLALRPLVPRPGVEVVPLQQFVGLADSLTLSLDPSTPLPPAPEWPDLEVRVEGDLHLSSLAIFDIHLGRATHALHFVGDRSPCYRVSILTGGGYIACVLPNETPDADDGRVSLGTLLARGRYAEHGDDAMVALALNVPAAIDVSLEFPLLVEGGARVGPAQTFVPRARTARPLTLRLDRDYCRWLSGLVEDPRAR